MTNIKAAAIRARMDNDLVRQLPDRLYNDPDALELLDKVVTENEEVESAISEELQDEVYDLERKLDEIAGERDQYAQTLQHVMLCVIELINKNGSIRKVDLKYVVEGLFSDNTMPEAYDNGGKTIDRYTVYQDLWGSTKAIVCSDAPEHPQGVSTVESCPYKGNNGARIDFWDLPEAVQKHYINRFNVPIDE